MAAVLCPLSLQTILADGRPLVGAKVLIYDAGTTTPKTVYVDKNLQAAHARPILTNGQGRVPPIYIGPGNYKVRILTPGDVPIDEVDGLAGGVEPADAPSSYPLTDPYAVLRTGDVIWSYDTGSRTGFARLNGGTIGSAASGATEVAFGVPYGQVQPVGSAYHLFVHLWEHDASLPLYSGGVQVPRGTSAVNDWNANRQLILPDARGRALFGLDDMGRSPANVVQVTTAITTTNGSTSAIVSSATGLTVGMSVIATGIPAGTKISAISGTTLTLSAAATATGSSVAARFSLFSDAHRLGDMAGQATETLAAGQIPAHSHAGTTASSGAHTHTGSGSGSTSYGGGHSHPPGSGSYFQNGTGGGFYHDYVGGGNQTVSSSTTGYAGDHSHTVSVSLTTNSAGAHTHAFTTAEAGGGQAHNNLPPAMLGTWYMKL